VFFPESATADDKERVKTLIANLKEAGWNQFYIKPNTTAAFNERSEKFLQLLKSDTKTTGKGTVSG